MVEFDDFGDEFYGGFEVVELGLGVSIGLNWYEDCYIDVDFVVVDEGDVVFDDVGFV